MNLVNQVLIQCFYFPFASWTLGYGQTECAAVATVQMIGERACGQVGPPSPCVKIKLVDVPEMDCYARQNKGQFFELVRVHHRVTCKRGRISPSVHCYSLGLLAGPSDLSIDFCLKGGR